MSDASIPVLWLSGPSGVGKTAVAWEIYSQLIGIGIQAGYVDVDQLGMCYPEPDSDPGRYRMTAHNASAVAANFRAAGARCVIVSGFIDPRHGAPLEEFRSADLTTCRLLADLGELRERLVARGDDAERVGEEIRLAEEEMDANSFAAVTIDTTGLSVAEVAALVRKQAGGWPDFTMRDRSSGPPDVNGANATDGPILWLCGAKGVGKSTVGFSIYLKVLRRGLMTAYVDVDQLGFFGPAPTDDGLKARNLAAVWRTYRDAGAQALVVVSPVRSETEVKVYAEALSEANITWCRLHAGRDQLTERILMRREGGSWHQPGDPLRGQPISELLTIAGAAIADAEALERSAIGFRVDTDGRTVEEVADAILAETRWPAGPSKGGRPS